MFLRIFAGLERGGSPKMSQVMPFCCHFVAILLPFCSCMVPMWDAVSVSSCADVKHNADDDLVALPERPAVAGFEPWLYTSHGALEPEHLQVKGIPRRSDILGAELPK